MKQIISLTKRNVKLFFKDKSLFFVSLITPMILLVLYVTFLGNVYKDSLLANLNGLVLSDKVVGGFVGAQLCSSILSVSCVTVAFCSNMLMVQDKASGALADLTVSPVKREKLGIAYFLATELTTLIVAGFALVASFVFLAIQGWFLSFTDVLLLILDVLLLTTFGTLLSSIVNSFLSTQGQISAVGTMVSSGYGFISGAYMPLSQFGEGLRKVLGFFPGTYGTSLLRNHAMRGVFSEMQEQGMPAQLVEEVKTAFDCNLYFFENKVELWVTFAVILGTVAVLFAVYLLIMKSQNAKRGK
ncbi:MAG: ABC transporter permease [Clostridia bacterium]|nr:ABC transporter permease [Clostridia bacterium]